MASIDLRELNRDGHILSGKDRGISARKHFRLDELDIANEPVDVHVPSDLRSISSSFFLGMFSQSIEKLGGKEPFLQHYRFHAKPVLFQQISHGIRRVVMKREVFSMTGS